MAFRGWAPPPPPPTPAPPATPPPPPTSPPPSGYIADGVRGDEFSIRNTTVGAGQDIWFDFTVTNTTDDTIRYGVLAAHTDMGFTAQSWTNASLRPRAVLEWTDHININTPGTYQIYLGICFSDKPSCLSGASWERADRDRRVERVRAVLLGAGGQSAGEYPTAPPGGHPDAHPASHHRPHSAGG